MPIAYYYRRRRRHHYVKASRGKHVKIQVAG
jgi:hypothetical protein